MDALAEKECVFSNNKIAGSYADTSLRLFYRKNSTFTNTGNTFDDGKFTAKER